MTRVRLLQMLERAKNTACTDAEAEAVIRDLSTQLTASNTNVTHRHGAERTVKVGGGGKDGAAGKSAAKTTTRVAQTIRSQSAKVLVLALLEQLQAHLGCTASKRVLDLLHCYAAEDADILKVCICMSQSPLTHWACL